MTHEYFLWIALFTYAMHVFEELMLGQSTYARDNLSKDFALINELTPKDLYAIYGLVFVSSFCSIMVGWHVPCFGLLLPTLLILHSLFFHVWATIRHRKMSPGVITSVVLCIPAAIASYWGAWVDQVLTWQVGCFAVLIAALFIVAPVFFLKLRQANQN